MIGILRSAYLFIPTLLIASAAWKSSWLAVPDSETFRYPSSSDPDWLTPDWLTGEADKKLEQSKHLDSILQCFVRRSQIKEALVSDLIKGRTTLREVAAQFLLLNKNFPVILREILRIYPGVNEFEASARNVISYASGSLDSESFFHRWEALARLEAELKGICEECGKKAE